MVCCDNSHVLQPLEMLLWAFKSIVLFFFLSFHGEPHFILNSSWSSSFDELPYFKSFDINRALLCVKVEVGPDSVTRVWTGQKQLSDVQSRLNYTVFSDFHSRQHSGKFVEILLVWFCRASLSLCYPCSLDDTAGEGFPSSRNNFCPVNGAKKNPKNDSTTYLALLTSRDKPLYFI